MLHHCCCTSGHVSTVSALQTPSPPCKKAQLAHQFSYPKINLACNMLHVTITRLIGKLDLVDYQTHPVNGTV